MCLCFLGIVGIGCFVFFFFQAEDGIRDGRVTGVQTCALPILESLIEDGFAMTELRASDLDFNQFLGANKRYRLSPECFFEIQQILVQETERRLREGDRGLLNRVARYLPALPRDQYLKPGSLLKVMMSGPILTYLLGDPWTTGGRLTSSPVLRAEA